MSNGEFRNIFGQRCKQHCDSCSNDECDNNPEYKSKYIEREDALKVVELFGEVLARVLKYTPISISMLPHFITDTDEQKAFIAYLILKYEGE